MKILLAITKSNFGGAQRYVFDLATSFAAKGDDVVVVTGGDGALIERCRAKNIRVELLPTLGRDVSLKQDLLALRDLARIIKNEKPDILHINSSKIGAIGALIGRILFVPGVIFTAHGWAFNESRPWWQRFIIRMISIKTVLLAHKTILVSEETGRQLRWSRILRRKTIVIHNGKEAPEFLTKEKARQKLAQIEPKLMSHIGGRWTMSIGELHPIKNHDLMILATQQLAREYPDHCHLIIGNGELRGHLEEEIEKNDLSEKVFLLGQIENAASLLKAADIFVLPSHSEALPYVLIEATQAGLPIVASDVGGIPEVIENGESGVLVHADRADELAHAIAHLFDTPSETSRIAAGAKARSHAFTLKKMVDRTHSVYHSIINK